VVLCGPRCNKFVSRLFKFLVFFYRLKYICHQTTPKLHLLFLLWAYHPKTCMTNASKICQFLKFGLHPHKLTTLRATIGLIITSCYRIKLIKIKVDEENASAFMGSSPVDNGTNHESVSECSNYGNESKKQNIKDSSFSVLAIIRSEVI